MEQVSLELTVYFEDGFYRGLFESRQEGKVSVCRVTLGAEPKSSQLLDFINQNFSRLTFSPSVVAEKKPKKLNPKRLQRQARREQRQPALCSQSQEALRLQREEFKRTGRIRSKAEKTVEQERKFALRQAKRRDKHRGH